MNNEMSVVLGTVAIEPRGEYNSSTYYDKLNTVNYEGYTYMAKQPCQNIVPTNDAYWQKISGGVTKEELGTIIRVIDEELITFENNTEYEKITSENVLSGEKRKSNYELYDEAIKLSNLNAASDKIRVGTFNIQNQNVPYNRGIYGYEKINKLKRIYTSLKCDILGLNEALSGSLYTPETQYLNEFYKYFTQMIASYNIKPQLNYGPGIISKNECDSSYTKRYSQHNPGEHRGYVKNVYSIGNKTLSFYCTHLDYVSTYIPQQISELYTDVSSDTSDYIIIVGDFNFDLGTGSSTYLSDFINAGFKQVNGGQYITFPSSNSKLDEILVSSNIDIIDSGTYTSAQIENLSDHTPLWAELELK